MKFTTSAIAALCLLSGSATGFAPSILANNNHRLGSTSSLSNHPPAKGAGGMFDTRDPKAMKHEDPRKSISEAPSFEEYLRSRQAAAGGAPAPAAAAPAAPSWSAPAAPAPAPAKWAAPAAPAWNAPSYAAAPAPAPATPSWSAPAAPSWSAPAAPSWSAPAAPSWSAPAAPSWSAPAAAAPAGGHGPAKGAGGMFDTRDPAPKKHEDPRKSINEAPSFEEYMRSRQQK